ncbi:MAG: hypothetical protein HGA98_00965 [Deltaproteobacteria bacterium]|nr:hypothetical protein [Deltaproteobacteria bacterium]
MNRAVLALLSCLALASAAAADVTVERFVKSGGLAGVGANETVAVEKLSAGKKREATSTKLTGSLAGFLGSLAKEVKNDTLTDVAKDSVWTFDHEAKTFSRSSISEAYRTAESAADKQTRQEKRDAKDKKSETRVVRNEVTVRETGQTKDLNGFPCVQYVVTWLLELEDTKTGERTKTVMTNELWNTPETKETKALAKEEAEFDRAYWKRAGADVTTEEKKGLGLSAMAGMLGQDDATVQAGVKDLQEKLSKIKGFSISTAIRWQVNPKDGQEEKAAKKKKKSEEAEESGGRGGFFSALRKAIKKDVTGSDQEEIEPDQSAQEGVLFDSYTEIRKISVAPVPAADFQVPAGYKAAP